MKQWLERATPLHNTNRENTGLTGTGGRHPTPTPPVAGTLTPTRQKMLKENTVGKLFTIFEKKVKRYAGTVDDENVDFKNSKTVGNVEHQVDDAVDVDIGMEHTVDRAGTVVNIVNVMRNTVTKFGQEDEEIEEETKLSDPDHHGAELAAGDPLDRPEVWPDLGTETYLSNTETETETSCDITATLPSTSNLGFGIARGQHMLNNLWDGISQDRDWTEQSESEAEWPIGSSKRDLLG